MTTPRHESPDAAGSTRHEPHPASTSPAASRRSGFKAGRLVKPLFYLILAGAAGYVGWRYPTEVADLWSSLVGTKKKPSPAAEPKAVEPIGPWDGLLAVDEKAREAMGLETAEVKSQSEPIRLELLGTTEYISDTLTKVRPMFKGRVDKVHATVGQSVKKGDPLVDLYSTDLAQAKSAYEIEKIQWLYDKKLLEIREELLKSKTISQQLFDETRNNEMKNHREYQVARDKLMVYGLSDEEIDQVEKEPGSQKARLTLRSRTDGLVITRDVAAGNLYDENDTLLVIAPLDELWVWGNVFESDLDLVHLGQSWEIRFPFLRHTVKGKVEYISNRVDPATHAVRIRTAIPNHDGKFKSDMIVRGALEIPPVPGRVVVPRASLVVDDRGAYVFAESYGKSDRFERRTVSIVHEEHDHVVLDSGVKPGEKIAVVGALLLSQMYEDLRTITAESQVPSSVVAGKP